ncbi:beta strand repeat-containing protein, partial [Ramlibacter solisilvae]
MAFTITGSLAVDETASTQNAGSSGADKTGNDVSGGLTTLQTKALPFHSILAAVVPGGTPTGVAVSNAASDSSDGSALITGLANVTNLAFTNSTGGALSGQLALSSASPDVPLLTADGFQIYLYSHAGNDNVVFGRKANADGSAKVDGAVVFAAYLQPTDANGAVLSSDVGATGAKVWLVQYEAIQHPVTTNPDDSLTLQNLHVSVNSSIDFNLNNAPSGQNLFMMFGDGTPSLTETAIVVTGKDPITSGDTVNTGQGGGPTTLGTNSQQIVEGKGLYFTFVTGADPNFTVPNLTQGEAGLEANISFTNLFSATAAEFKVVQVGGGDDATVELFASTTVNQSGTQFLDNLHNNTAVGIDQVTVVTPAVKQGPNTFASQTFVFNKVGGPTTVTTNTGNVITVSFGASTAKIQGVEQDYVIQYHTVGVHHRVLIDNPVTADSAYDAPFDIGGFRLISASSTPNPFSALSFQDDGPSVTATATNEAAVVLTTQDAQTIGALSDSDVTTANFSGVFGSIPVYGADGAGTTTLSYVVSLYGANGGLSGMSSDGVAIRLYTAAGGVVGSTATSAANVSAANTIFSITVGASTGIVTLTQFAEIDHAVEQTTGSPFDDQFATLANNLVKLTGTALTTDGDGDTATHSVDVDLGGNVRFADDGPSVTATATNEAAVVLTTQDAQTIGALSDSDVTTANFSGVFGATPAYGADGAGTTTLSYVVSLYGANGSASGMASNGVAINLYTAAGGVVGSTATTAAGVTVANTIFSITVGASTGIVTLTQFAEIDHAVEQTTGSPFDDQFATLANNLVKLTGTALTTDGDGDTATHSVDVDLGGNVRFADDGPSVTATATNEAAVVLTTQDAQTIGALSDSDVTTANFSGVFGSIPVYGADGAGTTSLSYVVSLYGANGDASGMSSNGAGINLYTTANGVVGSTALTANDVSAANTIFSITVGASTGIVTLTQFAEIDHAVEQTTGSPFDDQFATLANNLVKLTGTALTTDGDGDTATHSVDVDLGGNVRFADDGPSVTATATNEAAVVLTTQDAQTIGALSDSDVTTANFSGVFGSTPVYGADGAGTTSLSYVVSLYGANGGLSGMSSDGVAIRLYTAVGGVVGSTATSAANVSAANTIFSITVGASTGIVTLTQFAEIDHAVEQT